MSAVGVAGGLFPSGPHLGSDREALSAGPWPQHREARPPLPLPDFLLFPEPQADPQNRCSSWEM